MASNAIRTKGTKLEINTSGSTYVQIKGFNGFSGLGGGSPAVIDVTDFDSTAKEKLMGMPDEGQIQITAIYLPKDAGQLALEAARGTQAATKFRITVPDGTKWEYTAFVMTTEISGADDDKVTLASTLEVTGSVVKTAGA